MRADSFRHRYMVRQQSISRANSDNGFNFVNLALHNSIAQSVFQKPWFAGVFLQPE